MQEIEDEEQHHGHSHHSHSHSHSHDDEHHDCGGIHGHSHDDHGHSHGGEPKRMASTFPKIPTAAYIDEPYSKDRFTHILFVELEYWSISGKNFFLNQVDRLTC